MDDRAFRVTYWGTTGSLTRPLLPAEVTDKLVGAIAEMARHGALADLGPDRCDEKTLRERLERCVPFHLRSTYGGNTTCIEIQTSDELLIIDSGSGFRELGIELVKRWNSPAFRGRRTAHVLLTHAHMDHTYGTAFFDPYYDKRNQFTVWGPITAISSLNAVLSPTAALKGVYFPPTFQNMSGIKQMNVLAEGAGLQIGETFVQTYELRHPGGSTAYSLERDGRKIVIATDHEQTSVPDYRLAAFAHGADLLYSDAQYVRTEYEGTEGIPGEPALSRKDWGHSTIEACVATAAVAEVRRLHLGHREPKRSDCNTASLEHLAKQLMADSLRREKRDPDECEVTMCHEGLTLDI